MSNFNKFDTQIHIEETNEYQPTAADLAEYAEWLDEVEGDMPFPEDEEFQLSAPENWDGDEDSLGELSTFDGGEYDEYDGQPDEYTEWQDYMGGDDWDHGQYDHDPAEYEWDCDLHNEF